MHQIQFFAGDNFRVGGQVLQRHIGGKQVGDAGGIEFSGAGRFGIENPVGSGVIYQNLPCLHILSQPVADLMDLGRQNISYYCNYLTSLARRYGYSTFVWDNNYFGNGADKFGILDRRKNMNPTAQWMLRGIFSK